ncbi:hypothetical protein ACQCVH_22665 [Bacillus infantis]|uniref:hypothetical protein n=1 Tax=Bacillus infantis TaxID=324767 RepID=UPI003CEC0E92
MLKKFIMPIIYISEWVVFVYTVLFMIVFNLTYYVNMVIIDMPWEERTSLPFIKTVIFMTGACMVCFLYIKYLNGSRIYKNVKDILWGILFGVNSLLCILLLGMSLIFELPINERVLLALALIASAGFFLACIRSLLLSYIGRSFSSR